MSEYRYSELAHFIPTSDGVFLGLLKTDRIPPHLILCIGEKFFSLEKGKSVVNGDLPWLIAKLNRNHTSCLFVRLPDLPKGEAIHLANGCYLKYMGADGRATCLDPLKQFTSKAFGWSTLDAKVVFDILDELSIKGGLTGHAQLNIPSGKVSLIRYTRDDVVQHIRALGCYVSVLTLAFLG